MNNYIFLLNNLKILPFTLFIFFFDLNLQILNLNIQSRYFLVLGVFVYIFNPFKIETKKLIYFILFCLFIYIHLFYNQIIYSFIIFDLNHYLKTTAILFFIGIILINFNFIFKNLNILFFQFIFILIFILLFNFIFNYNNLERCLTGCFNKTRFIYKENSHLAYIGLTTYLYVSYLIFSNKINTKWNKLILILFTIFSIILFSNKSITLLTGAIISSILILILSLKTNNLKYKIFLFFTIILSIVISQNFDNKFNKKAKEIIKDVVIIANSDTSFIILETETKKKLNKNFLEEYNTTMPIKNLSSEVLLFNFKVMIASFKKNIFGYGINSYELVHEKFSKYIPNKLVGASWLNSKDGSNIFIKSIAEFGIFSLINIFLFIYFLFNKNIKEEYKIIIIPTFIIQVLIRGSGYMNGGFIFFYIIFLYLIFMKKHNTN